MQRCPKNFTHTSYHSPFSYKCWNILFVCTLALGACAGRDLRPNDNDLPAVGGDSNDGTNDYNDAQCQAIFSLEPNSPWKVPFPSNAFSVNDASMVTGRRIELPLPTDPTQISERDDILATNQLDGFNPFPRFTLPFIGNVPDASSFNEASVFIMRLSQPERGKIISIDQRLIDTSDVGMPRLIFAPETFLAQSSRYAVIVSDELKAGGQSIAAAAELSVVIAAWQKGNATTGFYDAEIHDALDALNDAGINPATLLTMSVFTTRTVTDVAVKLRDRLDTGAFSISEMDHHIVDDGSPAVFPAGEIDTMSMFYHRATHEIVDADCAQGSLNINFSAGTLVAIFSGNDWEQGVYLEKINDPEHARIEVPEGNLTNTGAVLDTNICDLNPVIGDKIMLVVEYPILRWLSLFRPYGWDNNIGSIAFARFEAPRYVDASGEMPVVATGPEAIPTQTNVDTIIAAIALPAGPTPVDGWPTAIYAHGGGGIALDTGFMHLGPIFAAHDMATISFNAMEHGGGPESYIEIGTSSGTKTVRQIGRVGDWDNDGIYGSADGSGNYTRNILSRVSDVMTLARSMHLGIDLDGTEGPDLAISPEHTFMTGISFGGATTTITAAIDPSISLFAPNVPGSSGSWGYFPRLGLRWDAAADLAARIPALTNAPSSDDPLAFDEDVPLKDQAVQIGLVEGAEPIQKAFDFELWRHAYKAIPSYARALKDGSLRGAAAPHFLQLVRGDTWGINPVQWLHVKAGELLDQTEIIRLDVEPGFDADFGWLGVGFARHIMLGLPYSGNSGDDIGGHICHLAREQIALWLKSAGTVVTDPDSGSDIFAGDVFEYPIPDDVFAQMAWSVDGVE